MDYEVIEWGYLTNQRAQELHNEGGLDSLSNESRAGMPVPWTLKGTEYLWLRRHIGDMNISRALDIGPQSSPIPQAIAEDCGIETWAIDKFADKRTYAKDRHDELSARQGGDPRDLYKDVRYVNAFMGESNPELKDSYFDLAYSLSTLEHIDYDFMPAVFQDIDRVLKPGGYMAHAVDLSLPLGVSSIFSEKLKTKSEKADQIRRLPFSKMATSILSASSDGRFPALPLVLGQWIYHVAMNIRSNAEDPYLLTASGWAKFLKRKYSLSGKKLLRSTGLTYGLLSQDPYRETVRTRYEIWPPENQVKQYWPVTTLMFILRKKS